MPAGSAFVVVAVLVVAVTITGVIWRARTGRVRPGTQRTVTPGDLGLASRFGARATLLQFSTEFCAQCPAARRVLGSAAEAAEGVEHVEVDLTSRPDLASRFNILSTPTVLLLDGDGRIRGRIGGAPRPQELADRLTELLEGRPDARAA